jgi:serine/threonine protein kinase
MNHPHIAKVLDADATESGSPYFVMELVKGIPITEFCNQHKLNLSQKPPPAHVFEQVVVMAAEESGEYE